MYSLTVVRMRSTGTSMVFENTETHDIVNNGTLISCLLGINADDTASWIQKKVANVSTHGRSTIQLSNEKLNLVWFCYITKFN